MQTKRWQGPGSLEIWILQKQNAFKLSAPLDWHLIRIYQTRQGVQCLKETQYPSIKPEVSHSLRMTICPLEPKCLWISLQSCEQELSQEWPQVHLWEETRRKHMWSHPLLTCRQGGMLMWLSGCPFWDRRKRSVHKKEFLSLLCFSFCPTCVCDMSQLAVYAFPFFTA